jgi:hypothetical protein
MKLRIAALALSFLLLSLIEAAAQEATNQPQPRRAAPNTASGPVGALVTLEIALIDRPTSKDAGALPSATDLLQLEKQGEVDRVTRAKLSSVGGRKALVQLGESVPTVAGRTFAGRGFSQSAQRESSDGPPRFSYSINMENIGTLVTATPQVEDGGMVLVELQVERSRLAEVPMPADDDRVADMPRHKTVRFVSQSTVRLKPGEPALAQGFSSSSGQESRGEYIVVVAHVESPARSSADIERPTPERQFRVYRLANVKASDLAPVLEKVIANREVRLAADDATNTILIAGPAEHLQIAQELIRQLDESKK